MLLSLGTGHSSPDDLIGATTQNPQSRSKFIAEGWAMIENLIGDQLECDKAWSDTVRMATALCGNNRELTSRYIRLNVEIPGRIPRLDQAKRVGELEGLALAKGSEEEREVAHRLIASCFFSVFQPAVPTARAKSPLLVVG